MEIKAALSQPHPILALIIIAIIMIAPTMTIKKLDNIYNKPTTTTYITAPTIKIIIFPLI